MPAERPAPGPAAGRTKASCQTLDRRPTHEPARPGRPAPITTTAKEDTGLFVIGTTTRGHRRRAIPDPHSPPANLPADPTHRPHVPQASRKPLQPRPPPLRRTHAAPCASRAPSQARSPHSQRHPPRHRRQGKGEDGRRRRVGDSQPGPAARARQGNRIRRTAPPPSAVVRAGRRRPPPSMTPARPTPPRGVGHSPKMQSTEINW